MATLLETCLQTRWQLVTLNLITFAVGQISPKLMKYALFLLLLPLAGCVAYQNPYSMQPNSVMQQSSPYGGSLLPPSGDVIEARIDGEFTGWSGETIFKLNNGQIWQQAEYSYEYHYAYNPEVTIIRTSSGFKLRVEGMSSTIHVNRLK